MADSFGIKLGVEGEKEFKSALSDINRSFKVLGSEMKLVQSQFGKNDKSVYALTARNQVHKKRTKHTSLVLLITKYLMYKKSYLTSIAG